SRSILAVSKPSAAENYSVSLHDALPICYRPEVHLLEALEHGVRQALDVVDPVDVTTKRVAVTDEVARGHPVHVLRPRLQVDQQSSSVVAVVHAVRDIDGHPAQRVYQVLEDVEADDRVVVDGH